MKLRWLLLALASACAPKTFGNGIGRPEIVPVERVERVPLEIVEVYAAAADPALHYARLELAAGAPTMTLTGVSVCDSAACVDLAGGMRGGDARQIDLSSLALPANAGELAVVHGETTATPVTYSYLAWGADPATLGSTRVARAVLDGATTPGDFVPVPFPMPAELAVARAGSNVGCVTAGLAAPVAPAACPAAERVLDLTEVYPAAAAGGDSWIELTNAGATALSLYGVRVCRLPQCAVLGRDVSLEPAARLSVHFGVAASDTAADRFYPSLAPLSRAAEVVVLAPGSAVATEAHFYQAFVRMGAAADDLAPVAAGAGLWPEPLAAVRTVRVDGESLSHDLSRDRTASAWYPTTPTPGEPNPDIRFGGDLWDSCSFPAPWREAPRSPLVIERLTQAPAGIELANRSEDGSTVSFVGLSLFVSGVTMALDGQGELAAGAVLFIDQVLFIDLVIGDNGEAALLQDDGAGGTRVVQYLRWGEGAASVATPAVLAGVWPLERCGLPVLTGAGVITLNAGLPGHSPPDYH
ncbi:MAG: hypothetical protein HY903_00550 [Deltaproteobacteria bacterium]|nr:hypothetical protein [Deltaproteobacteria bacterium]